MADVSLKEVVDWVFGEEERKGGLVNLKKLLDLKDPLLHVKAHFPGRKLEKEVENHLTRLTDPEPLTEPETAHRNAMVHSGKTLDFIFNVKKGGTVIPPPWVC